MAISHNIKQPQFLETIVIKMDILFENFLNTLAYRYYPKKLNESSEEYFISKQRKNFLKLLGKWNSFMNEDFNKLIFELNKTLDYSLTINNCFNNFPCFQIEIIRNKELFQTTNIYISFFIPFYHIVNLNGDLNTGKINFNYKICPEINNKTKGIIKRNINYSQFPTALLNKNIPKLEVRENFDYKGAFFTDNYRISFF
jgi:hypothetical protein